NAGRSVWGGDRTSGGPGGWGGGVRAGLAALRARAVAWRTVGTSAAACASWLRCGRARRAAGDEDPRRDSRFPGEKWPDSRWFCLRGYPRPAARALTIGSTTFELTFLRRY